MLPRLASVNGTLQPSLAPQTVAPVEAARPPLSAAALADLRAELLLRLIETMLRHIPRGPGGAAGRDLLEALFAALKSLPGREGESGRRLADLLSRLPAELRPAAEKLVNAALSAMPARNLAGILRNPETPEAHRLAVLLAANLPVAGDDEAPAPARAPRFSGLTVPQLDAMNRHGSGAPTQAAASEPRASQAALQRLFDPDGDRAPPPAGRTTAEPPRQPGTATVERAPAERTDPRPPAEAGRGEPVAQAPRAGQGESIRTAPKSEAAENAPARPDAMQAAARKTSPEPPMQALVRLVEKLTEEDVQILRVLLDKPLDAATGPARPVRDGALPVPADAGPETHAASIRPGEAEPEPAQARREPDAAPAAVHRPPAAVEEPRAGIRTQQPEAATVPAPAEAAPTVSLPLREGIPAAFVPYLIDDDALDLSEAEEAAEEEETDEDEGGGQGAKEQEEPQADAEEPEPADMAGRRRKTDDLLGAREPGLDFAVRPGDYWT